MITPAWALPVFVLGGLVGSYAAVLRGRPDGRRAWPWWRTAAWVAGALLVAAGVSPPLAETAPHDHRYHMAQHLLLGMYAPLGLVLGAPVSLLLGTAPRAVGARLTRVVRRRPVHVLTHPVTAAVLNVGGLLLLYLTPLYAVSRSRADVSVLVTAHLLLAGYLYTWAIAGTDPAPRPAGLRARLAVLVVAGGVHAFLAKHLYAQADSGLHHGPDVAMAAAARLMYYGGDVAEVLLAVVLFGVWFRRRSRAREKTAWLSRPA